MSRTIEDEPLTPSSPHSEETESHWDRWRGEIQAFLRSVREELTAVRHMVRAEETEPLDEPCQVSAADDEGEVPVRAAELDPAAVESPVTEPPEPEEEPACAEPMDRLSLLKRKLTAQLNQSE